MIQTIAGQSVSLLKNNQKDFNARNLDCSDDNENYCQFVSKQTFTQFQVKLTPSTGTQLLLNANFANNINDWSTSGIMTASHSTLYGGSARLNGRGQLQQVLTSLTVGKYYYIEAIVRDFTRISDGFISAVGLSVNATFDAQNAGFSYLPNQTVNVRDKKIQIWFTATNTTHIISLVTVNANVLFEYCTMVELTIPISKVTTCEGEDVLSNDVRLFNDKAIISVDWSASELEEDNCYKICVYADSNSNVNLLTGVNAFWDNFFNFIVDNNGNKLIGG